MISGPTTAISIVIFSAVSHHAEPFTPEFISLALTITFLAGIYQFILGIARMGILVNFVSHTVVIGFTAGAAILIATSQMKNILGIEVPRGESFMHTWMDIWNGLGGINSFIAITAISTLASALAIKKLWPKAPHLLLSLIIGSLVAALVGGTT